MTPSQKILEDLAERQDPFPQEIAGMYLVLWHDQAQALGTFSTGPKAPLLAAMKPKTGWHHILARSAT